MTLRDWAESTASDIRRRGIRGGGSEAFYQLQLGFYRRYYNARFRGNEESIFDREWDVMVVLDACRCDLIESVESEYGFLTGNGRFRSRGTHSKEWMRRNFVPEYRNVLSELAYVTGNIWTDEYVDPNGLAALDEVWRYAWDEQNGTVLPRSITERAVSVAREAEPERLLVHYMQPHAPSVPDPIGEGMNRPEMGGKWRAAPYLIRDGEASKERVMGSYRENLRYVLDEVELLLNNVDGEKVVITADHGEAFGEYGVYEHPFGMPFDMLRTVPWYVTSATDSRSLVPTLQPSTEQGDRREKLRALGYV
ncbi:sulfatase-like hydrolase/transferase [Halogeometricum luteum]|uniref:LTA synthase family protein n=1 Tax=Halogeometricum luteum TaxID=2950537 RepID=A0ABU2FXP6_9EURY|nr:sulfatase-like hydrolase/transferase [Halogeometricum sp. S3BR5-2]MDS0292779.1 LTA synthase family protein [Halogeometricum sp. S3BR5-2]